MVTIYAISIPRGKASCSCCSTRRVALLAAPIEGPIAALNQFAEADRHIWQQDMLKAGSLISTKVETSALFLKQTVAGVCPDV